MALTAKMFCLSVQSAFNKEINFASDTIKVMLVTSTYVPNQDTHRYKSSVTNEVTGTGYTAGGVTLTAKTVSLNAATNVLSLGCANPSWAGLTATFRYLVFYDSTGSDATSPLLSYVDLGADQTVSGVTYTYVVPATGVAYFTVG